MKNHFKLGTRRSLLAWAQSSWVARELERLNPGIQIELVGIDTRGDKILDVSLQSVAGKEFFVAELDEALSSGAVDISVHSMKDLSLDRPQDFVLGAVPKRENPRDVLLFGPGVVDKIRAGKKICIGTSSPRRLENIPSFLRKALPQVSPRAGGEPELEFIEIRGNVNTRLSRVHEAENSPKQLDAVVLAFAGLIRLWADMKGREELTKLLQGVRWMVLPLRECPAASAQGALAVECREADARVREVVGKLHHEPTAAHAKMERDLLALWGGGCHQKFGATAIEVPGLGDLLFIRGMKPDGEFADELRWKEPAGPKGPISAWDGTEWRSEVAVEPSAGTKITLSEEDGGVFVSHSRAVFPEMVQQLQNVRIWTSGVSSWQRLAKLGLWVEGCAESMGFSMLVNTLKEGVLQLPDLSTWVVLTHESAEAGWTSQRVLTTYRVQADYPASAGQTLRNATHIFWSSGSQFDELREWAPAHAVHCSGPGKTAEVLRQAGIQPLVFPSIEEWRKWLSTAKPAN